MSLNRPFSHCLEWYKLPLYNLNRIIFGFDSIAYYILNYLFYVAVSPVYIVYCILFIVYCILYIYALYSAAKTAGILGSHHFVMLFNCLLWSMKQWLLKKCMPQGMYALSINNYSLSNIDILQVDIHVCYG